MKTDILRPLVSTFDSEIMSIFIEAHFWDKLHNEEFVTPNEVLGIFHQREVLRIVRGRVMVFVSAYNAFIGHLKGTSMLYLDHLKILDKKLRPGFKKIPWSIRPVVIDKFVQVGAGCIIYPGIHLKEGSVVGGMSLVTRDLNEWTIYKGVPAKTFKPRNKNARLLAARISPVT